jgi:hypothetical protein
MADLIDDAEIDFDRAASAFPDISLDGEGDFSAFTTLPTHAPAPAGPFDLDAFGGPTPTRDVRVTGHDSDDEIGKFESEFPELEEPQVRCGNIFASMLCPCSPQGAQDPNTDDNHGRQATHPPLNPHLVLSLLLRHAHSRRLFQQLQS